MATPAQPVTSKTTLPSLDDLKPSIDVSGDSGTIQAIVTNATFPDSPANITVGQLKAQSSAGGQFNLPGVNNVPVGFSVSASVNAALAAYQNPSTLVSDLGLTDPSGNTGRPAGYVHGHRPGHCLGRGRPPRRSRLVL